MKTIYTLLTALLLSTLSNAQSPIIDIETLDFKTSTDNAYYKDVNNFYDDFEGTWLYTNGTTSFKIVLAKEEMLYSGKYYMDDIAGEYQYIENGTELINTLSNTDQYQKSIWGSRLIKKTVRPICDDCPSDERRLRIAFSDRTRNNLNARVTLKKIMVGSQQGLEAFIWGNGVGAIDPNNPPAHTTMTIPYGTFVFIKQ